MIIENNRYSTACLNNPWKLNKGRLENSKGENSFSQEHTPEERICEHINAF